MERLKFPGRLSDISQTTWKHCCSQPPAASTDSLMLHHPRFPETRSYIGPILHKGASPFSHLPREIYDPIVRSISRKDDLLSLCLCSRLFRYECQRVLYDDVRLRGTPRLIAFANAILSNPILGPLVHKLTLPTRAFLSPYERQRLRDAIRRLSSLHELYLKHRMTQFECANAYVDPELLEGSSAELELFHTELDYPDGSLPLDSPFFKQHPHLNHLHLAWESCPEPLTLAPCLDCQRGGRLTQLSLGPDLPNLRQLHVENPDLLSLFSGCPLRCLHLKNVIMTSEKISMLSRFLGQFSRTLTNLGLQVKFPTSLAQTVERESGIVCNLVQSICSSLPKLNVLSLSGEIIIAPERCSQWLPLSNTALETLVLNTSKREYHISDSQSIQGTNSPEKNGRDLALAIFEIAPAIQRFAVGRSGCIAEAGGSWCYARRNGKVCFEGRGVLGEDCWMKV